MDGNTIITVLKDYKNGDIDLFQASLSLILIGLSKEEVTGLLDVKVIEKLTGETNEQLSPSST